MALVLDLLAAPAAAPVATCSATITVHPPYAPPGDGRDDLLLAPPEDEVLRRGFPVMGQHSSLTPVTSYYGQDARSVNWRAARHQRQQLVRHRMGRQWKPQNERAARWAGRSEGKNWGGSG
jgi:hypothetical protein